MQVNAGWERRDRQRNLAYNINSSRFYNFSIYAIDLIYLSVGIFLRIKLLNQSKNLSFEEKIFKKTL